jgi:hypothetical protein
MPVDLYEVVEGSPRDRMKYIASYSSGDPLRRDTEMSRQNIIDAMDGSFVVAGGHRFSLSLDEDFLYEMGDNPLWKILDFCGIIERPKAQFVAEIVDNTEKHRVETVLSRLRNHIKNSPSTYRKLENAMTSMCEIRRIRAEI